jgi:mRNA interferase YafQ
MLIPEYLNSFKKSYKNFLRGGRIIRTDVENIVQMISEGKILQIGCQDHKLNGEYEGYRECHIKKDILIIYKIDKSRSMLILRNIGTHEDLF